MREVTLNATKAGMTRLREKGGASPDTLWLLKNGFINASKTPQQRPGTTWTYTFPAHTKGLCAFKDVLRAFSSKIIDTGREDFIVHTLRHPTTPDFDGDIKDIHFAAPFLGFLYVVAEFDDVPDGETDGTIAHYYLRDPATWEADHAYFDDDLVQPSTPNGYYYKPTTANNPPAWAPGVERAEGDVVQPTVRNGFEYTVVSAGGGTNTGGGGSGGGGGGTVPFGRIESATITYVPSGGGTRTNAPITTWEEVFGHINATDDPVAFPGRSASSPVLAIPRDGYVCMQIDVPADFDTDQFGWVTHTEYNYGANLTASISTTPGDFNPATALTVAVTTSGQTLAHWHGSTSSASQGAQLEPSTTYYYNIKVTDPTADWLEPPGNQINGHVGLANAFSS